MAHFKSAVVLCSVYFIAGALGLLKTEDKTKCVDIMNSMQNLSSEGKNIVKALLNHDQDGDGNFDKSEIDAVCDNDLKGYADISKIKANLNKKLETQDMLTCNEVLNEFTEKSTS
ncbi:uncharacterized protein LOC126898764 isoform X2 [Daktulosphaira vitifoliae]|uniref:uncharacterized protein LOC126898764 isoform X2 n=1 Tax=Daktulosphaira vitifoliae TaxID=58002 RepID=UPI0021AAE978|nr:uncharacterized protein LOC126898764 isoform X2 [Daktulosphaira vitifoliae]